MAIKRARRRGQTLDELHLSLRDRVELSLEDLEGIAYARIQLQKVQEEFNENINAAFDKMLGKRGYIAGIDLKPAIQLNCWDEKNHLKIIHADVAIKDTKGQTLFYSSNPKESDIQVFLDDLDFHKKHQLLEATFNAYLELQKK